MEYLAQSWWFINALLNEWINEYMNEQINRQTVLSYIPGGEGDTLKLAA